MRSEFKHEVDRDITPSAKRHHLLPEEEGKEKYDPPSDSVLAGWTGEKKAKLHKLENLKVATHHKEMAIILHCTVNSR